MNQQLPLLPTRTQDVGIVDDLKSFCAFGQRTQIEQHKGHTYFINEYWTSGQRKAHRLHEVSYRACFKPQLPRFFIDRLTEVGDIVYDPFMGRGTTPIEAALCGRVPYGNDANPLSRALTEPRINPPSLAKVQQRLSEIPWASFRRYEHDELLVFYHAATLAMIEGLRSWLFMRQESRDFDAVDDWIRMVAINRLTGHSSGFFSVYTLPPNQAVSIDRQAKINHNRNQIPPERNVPKIILKKSKSLLSQRIPTSHRGCFTTRLSHETPDIRDNSISLTVTSPPFVNIVNYESDNWLRCWFLGIDPKKVRISKYSSVDAWQSFVASTLKEISRVTKDGGHIAFEVGEVRNGEVLLEENVLDAAADLPINPLGVMINEQNFTKTSNCWGISNNNLGTNSNRIVIFRKE